MMKKRTRILSAVLTFGMVFSQLPAFDPGVYAVEANDTTDTSETTEVVKEQKKSGWVEENGKWYYYRKNEALTGIQVIKGETYYFAKNGVMRTGWQKIDSDWCFFASTGKLKTGWLSYRSKWYFLDLETGKMVTGWKTIGKQKYFFDANGIWIENAQDGWVKTDNKWYYYVDNVPVTGFQTIAGQIYCFKADGVMKTGWVKKDQKWYYFKSSGVMAKGWLKIKKTWYFLDLKSCEMVTGWQTIGRERYYFDANGVWIENPKVDDPEVAKNWTKKNGKWYYILNGTPVTGWKTLSGKTFYFDENGVMQTGFRQISGEKYYFTSSGAMAKGWSKVSSSWYYFEPETGKMLTGWQKIGKEQYFFDSNGVMQSDVWKGNLYLRSDGSATDEVFSREYMGSKYYTNLQNTLKSVKDDKDIMNRVLAIAQSQEGYKNYSVSGIEVSQARKNGYLWTGAKERSNGGTGNTEYTRWAQRYMLRRAVSSQYADYDWCAIFASWCLYQGGLYSGHDKKTWYYSYCADPRIEKYSIMTSFNCDQAQVWYTPTASNKIAAYSEWNEYVHTEVTPYDIPYRPGGLIFFSWDGTGRYFSHVGIVVSYDEKKHVLRYISGNCSGQVLTYDVYYDKPIWSGVNGYDTIMAYAEYYEGKEAWKINSKGKLSYYKNGKALTGWQTIDGRKYFFDENGYMVKGWKTEGSNKYYLSSSGTLVTGWRDIGSGTYYFDSKGVLLTGWQTIDGKRYRFNDTSGKMYAGGWWDGKKFNSDGTYDSNYDGEWHKDSKGWWFGKSSGWYIKSQTVKIDGKTYIFDDKGYTKK